MILSFEIPDLPKMPNQLLRKHWAIVMKEKNKWHRLIGLCCIKYNKLPLKKAKITFTRYSTRQPDFDGLAGSFKYVVDGLVKAKVIVDDSYDVIGESSYKWVKCKQAEQRVSVEVYGDGPDGVKG